VAGALIPDASTYGWDWDGVRANAERMLPEMAVGRERLDGLAQAVRDVLDLPDVDVLVRGTLA
jgi:hypothetical protein